MGRPPFVMSKYATLQDLLMDKAAHYEQLAKTIAANVDNNDISDEVFRQFVRNCMKEPA